MAGFSKRLDRQKLPPTLKELKDEADNIMDEFVGFVGGLRCIMCIRRAKDGKKKVFKKQLVQGSEQYRDALVAALALKEENPGMRIYASVNERDPKKAIREFRRRVEEQLYDPDPMQFYSNLRQQFLSSAQIKSSRTGKTFLWDVDSPATISDFHDFYAGYTDAPEIYRQYATKNGWHVLTPPFNYAERSLPENISLDMDSMLLLSY